MGGEGCAGGECQCSLFEVVLELQTYIIGWTGPEVPLDVVVWVGQRPRKFEHDIDLLSQGSLDWVGVLFEHEDGWDGDVESTAVICHDGFMFFALGVGFRCADVFMFALTDVIGNDDRYCTGMLAVTDFLDKCTAAAVDHENEWGFPVGWCDER